MMDSAPHARTTAADPGADMPLPATVSERLSRMRARGVMLEVSDLSKRFVSGHRSVEALRGISLQVHRREFLSIVGPSGCGKSTLLRTLAGLESPSQGKVLVDGQPVTGPGQDRGVVFQGYSLFPWLSVKRNVMFGQTLRGVGRIEAERQALTWLDLVGLTRFADAYPHQLSGGMKQRVAIARALVNQPRVLLMDEPFGALDTQTRTRMQGHLLEIWRNIDITIVFITHDLDEAIFLSDRIMVLKPHPGELLRLIDVPLDRPREATCMGSAAYLNTKRLLEHLIHEPDPDISADERAVHPRMLRMTSIGDNVE
jgi:NitT/TauT family transport system ATP-binding protein